MTHLPQGAEYRFRVLACNAGGPGESAEVPGTVKITEMLGKTFQVLALVESSTKNFFLLKAGMISSVGHSMTCYFCLQNILTMN